MTKTIRELLTFKKSKWAVIDEKGNTLKVFRLKTTATQWIPILKLNRREKLSVIEIEG